MSSYIRRDLPDSSKHIMKPQVLSIPGRDTERITELLKKDLITALVKKEFPISYLVGGFLRDMILGQTTKDRDYVVIGSMNIPRIKRLADKLGGKFFVVKNLARIVLKDKSEIDITFTEDPIETDIAKRDFTINSLAWSDKTGLIDLFGGLNDIKKRTIRALREENIIADPVRILRAYRMAAEIGGVIELLTRRSLVRLRGLIKNSSKERITAELFKILNLKDPLKYLRMALDDEILSEILAVSNQDLDKNFKLFKKLNDFYRKNFFLFPTDPYSQGLSVIGVLRLSALSYGWKRDKSLLSLSRKNLKRLEDIHQAMKKIQVVKGVRIKREFVFDLFYEIKDSPHDLGLILGSKRLLREAERFKEVLKRPVITGAEIAGLGDIKKDEISHFLRYILRLQYLGKIRNKKDAMTELGKKIK